MAQTTLIIDTLKKTLKSYGKTYADVAEYLQLSEASVKRMFSQQSLSLQRLDSICEMLEIEISQLIQLANESTALQIDELSYAQEQELVADTELLLVTVCVLHNWSLEDMLQYYTLSKARCIQLLAQLDRLKLIELLPNNKIKLRVSPNFKWREGGPIQQFFQKNIETEFFNSNFSVSDEKLIVLNGMLSKESNIRMQRKLERLSREFDEMTKEDAPLHLRRTHGLYYRISHP